MTLKGFPTSKCAYLASVGVSFQNRLLDRTHKMVGEKLNTDKIFVRMSTSTIEAGSRSCMMPAIHLFGVPHI